MGNQRVHFAEPSHAGVKQRLRTFTAADAVVVDIVTDRFRALENGNRVGPAMPADNAAMACVQVGVLNQPWVDVAFTGHHSPTFACSFIFFRPFAHARFNCFKLRLLHYKNNGSIGYYVSLQPKMDSHPYRAQRCAFGLTGFANRPAVHYLTTMFSPNGSARVNMPSARTAGSTLSARLSLILRASRIPSLRSFSFG